MEYLFSFEGRISRSGWWIRTVFILPLLLALMSAMILSFAFAMEGREFSVGLNLVAIWVAIVMGVTMHVSTSVRRHHDLGNSGWNVLWVLFPVIGALIDIIMSGFVPGQEGPNKYGPSPKARSSKTRSDLEIRATSEKLNSVEEPAQSYSERPVKKAHPIVSTKRSSFAKSDSFGKQTQLVTRHVSIWERVLGKK
ncbi:DUF805 domain-containing protein [Hirschia maritima]|uniref:DUF805 domain-containing protein n=1 Tax=Hirschia maritima TaxID=1121961 RepID=UPI00036614CA|nr:DUF805 domain-containing protein [Hirschia maritima]